MKPWFPIDCVSWPEIVEMLAGRVWPEWAATADLRWHIDKGARVPPRRALQVRWRWSDRAVRAFLKDTATWWDPSKGPAPESRADVNPSGTQDGPKVNPKRTQGEPKPNGRTSATVEERTQTEPKADPKRTQDEPTSVHRARLHSAPPTPTPTPSPAPNMNGVSDPSASDGPCQVCGHIIAAGCRHGITGPLGADPGLSVTSGLLFHHRPPEAVQPPPATTDIAPTPRKASKASGAPAKGIADPNVARVWEVYRSHHPRAGEVPPKPWPVAEAVTSEGVEAILLVIEWAHTSEDPGAVQLREGGYLGETLFRPSKRGRYIELSAAWARRGRLAGPITAGRQLSAREQTNSDVDQWLKDNLKPRRDVIEAQEERKWIG